MIPAIKPPSPWRMALRVAAVPLIMLIIYGAYTLIDSSASAVVFQDGTITDKQCYEGRPTYDTRVVGGRTWIREAKTPTVYAVTVQADNTTLVGYVDAQQYAALAVGDAVTVKAKRRGLSGSPVVVEIRKHQTEVD